MRVTESNGKWTRAVRLGQPVNVGQDPKASIGSVSCTKSGSCIAVGSYTDTGGNAQAVVYSRSGGRWHSGTEIKLPGTAAANPQAGLRDGRRLQDEHRGLCPDDHHAVGRQVDERDQDRPARGRVSQRPVCYGSRSIVPEHRLLRLRWLLHGESGPGLRDRHQVGCGAAVAMATAALLRISSFRTSAPGFAEGDES